MSCIWWHILYRPYIYLDDQMGEDCYLGASMYSDGICEEHIGKINPTKGLIHMSKGRQPFMCPFFMYLTINNVSDNVVQGPR